MDKEKIIVHFGEEFYRKVICDMDRYAKIWNLHNFEQVDYYSINCIFMCESEKHGASILKIGKPCQETITEYKALEEYSDNLFCNTYEADLENGVMLVERIIPGTRLREEKKLDTRLDVFCNLYDKFQHKKAKDRSVYPTYMGWVRRIADYMQKRSDYINLSRQMSKAEEICKELCEKYTREMLLHGDLHHDNILLGRNRSYRVIDPKGVIGDPVFDISRFILNEFDGEMDEGFYMKISHITDVLSSRLNIPKPDIKKLLFVEMSMAESWNVESDHEPVKKNVDFVENFMTES